MNQQIPSKLQANSFGWQGQFFQALAHMAPAAGVIMTAQFMATRGGAAIPLASLFAAVLALLIGYCLAMLTRKYIGASGYFQIHSRALGSRLGFTTSWLFFLYEPLCAFATSLGFGAIILEPFSDAYLGIHLPWWVAVIGCNLVVVVLALINVRSSIRTTAVLGVIEFLIIAALGLMLIMRGEPGFHPEYFTPTASPEGWGGLAFAFIFGFMQFIGFESGLPLTEETKDARNSTARGLLVSIITAGVFFTFISYATVVGFGGGNDPVEFAKSFGSAENPYGESLAIKAFGAIGAWLIFVAALNSTLACCLASHNSATRVFFSLGRAGILPRFLGKATELQKVPANAVLFAAAVTAIASLIGFVVISDGKPVDWFGFMGVLLTVPLLIIHLMTCLSVYIAYRYREGGFEWFKHGLLPLFTGGLILLPLWGSVYYNQAAPMSYAPYIVVSWFVVGLVMYGWLKATRPLTLRTLETEMDRLGHISQSI